jgi:hypothetical protein
MTENEIKDYTADAALAPEIIAPDPVAPDEATEPAITSAGKKRGRPKGAAAAETFKAPATPDNGNEPYMDARTRAELAAGAEALRRNQEMLKKAE